MSKYYNINIIDPETSQFTRNFSTKHGHTSIYGIKLSNGLYHVQYGFRDHHDRLFAYSELLTLSQLNDMLSRLDDFV